MEYQIERLHIYGDENPRSGLKNKVKRINFSEKLKVPNPITGEMDSKPLKPFMVNQLQIVFERDNMILSPYDEVLYKQLIDYEVEAINANGTPKFTSKEEHFVDALGLAYLAMVLEFKDLTGVMQDVKSTTEIKISHKQLGNAKAFVDSAIRSNIDNRVIDYYEKTDFTERPGERQQWIKMETDYRGSARGMSSTGKFGSSNGSSWGSRSPGGSSGRGGFGR